MELLQKSPDFRIVIKLFVLITFGITHSKAQCTKDEYKRCVTLADPLLKDPHLIYPDNMRDIDHVCRTWGFFVDCVKRYTDRCFTESKKKQFSKAVERPVDSVHQMCTMPLYQEEYLKHASCMKSALTEDTRCGRHYRHLVGQVAGEAARPTLCCSHHRLRECVLDQTRRNCQPDAGPYARQILDKALSFLKDQCTNYIPTELDCPGADFYTVRPANKPGDWKDVVRTTTPPPWIEPVGGRGPTGNHNWIPVSTGGMPMDPTRTSFSREMSGSGATTETNFGVQSSSERPENNRPPANKPDYNRPSSNNPDYNRPSSSTPEYNNQAIKSSSSRPDFSRPGGNSGFEDGSLSSDSPWTPQITNSIDEEEKPNQQGLANSSDRLVIKISLTVMSCFLIKSI